MSEPMDAITIEHALRAVGERLNWPVPVEILIVGGAAGLVTGVFPHTRTTFDCDVMVCSPENAVSHLEMVGEMVAAELGLPADWLNSKVQLRLDTLPDGWKERRIWVGFWGELEVYSASRLDLIAMKVLAGRQIDQADLQSMRVRRDEVPFVRDYLDRLPEHGTPCEQIEDARILLNNLRFFDDER